MKLKYYLYGFGVGIIFATIILSISFYLRIENLTAMTDTEIIEQAKKLGMVEEEKTEESSETETILETQSQETSSEEITEQEQSTSETLQETEQEQSTSETLQETTQEETTILDTQQETKTEQETTVLETTTKQITEESSSLQETSKKENLTEEKIEITVKSGMSSEAIAKLLEENGIITDASDFNHYMVVNGYSNKMKTGIYKIPPGADYETLAKVFCN